MANDQGSGRDGQQGAIIPDDEQRSGTSADAPYSLPDDVDDDLEDTHPRLDTNVDEHELYDEGKEGVTDSEVPDRPDGQDNPLSEDEGERVA
jgi:hypothetical protein